METTSPTTVNCPKCGAEARVMPHDAGSTKERTMTIERIQRLKSSVNGNPRFDIAFTDGSSATTGSNRSYCYEIGNRGMREGSTVTVMFTRGGHIAHMAPSDA